MKTVMAIEKREDRPKSQGESQYGDVKYADPVNKAYPIDSEKHVKAAWSYLNMPKNAAKYSAKDVATMKGRIKAAGKKYGIDFSDDSDNGDDGEKDKAESSLVYATSIDLQGQTPEEIVYMPRGDATIKPKRPGHEVKVKVDATVAQVLQADLEKRLDAEIQPYAGYDHNAGPASFHPKEFRWDDERGVILAVDWTEGGKQDVTGRNYSYFSPTFMLSKSGKVAGLPDDGEVGSLVNNPAFRDRKMKIAASADDAESDEMIKVAEKLVELEVITAEQADDPETVIKAITDMHVTIGLVQAANARLQSENTALQAKVAEVQKAEASSIVEAAIAEGKIPAKNQDAIDFWMGQLIANPEQAKKAMAATLQANPLLQKVIDVKAGDTKRVASGQSDADLVQAQHLAIDEVCAKNPGMTRAKAFDIAKREKPHVFPVEA